MSENDDEMKIRAELSCFCNE